MAACTYSSFCPEMHRATNTLIRQSSRMQPMRIRVVSARVVAGHVHATVRAEAPPRAVIHLRLAFPIAGPTDVWAAARDEALRYLDVG